MGNVYLQSLATLMPELELLMLGLFSASNSSFAFKETPNRGVMAQILKVVILTSYKRLSVGTFELKLHIYALGTSDTHFKSCKKGQ